MGFNRPSASEHRSVLNYIHKVGPVDDEESQYVYCREDLVTLRPGRENAWLDKSIERLLKALHCPLLEVSSQYLLLRHELTDYAVSFLF